MWMQLSFGSCKELSEVLRRAEGTTFARVRRVIDSTDIFQTGRTVMVYGDHAGLGEKQATLTPDGEP